MSRALRIFLLGCIALTYAYLLVHSREPLRLNIGDPSADASVLSSIGRYVGASDIGTFRLFGIGLSALAMWLLFHYARRMWSDTIALIATTLFTTSLFWMQYADSIHQAPVMQAAGFLALWGLVRAIETRHLGHYAAAIVGSFACFLTSYDYWLFLPAAVLVTVWVKLGNPFARGSIQFVALCAAGCVLAIVTKCFTAVGWTELLASPHDRRFQSGGLATVIRRATLVFTPMVWITTAYHVLKAIRAPSVTVALKDTAIWMLLVASAFLCLFWQRAASQMLASQVLLPFYAFGSAFIIDRWLGKGETYRKLALGWLVLAPLWSVFFMVTHPRSVLDRDDVAKVNAYLVINDRNDFMMSNVVSDGPIQAAFQRHDWPALDAKDTSEAARQILRVLELTGTDYLHAAIFTTPDSRFIDRSLWPLAMPRRMWSVTGWPNLVRKKANGIIRDYDRLVIKNLEAVEAKKVLKLHNFDLYRIDRASLLELSGRQVPVVSKIDFGSLASVHHTLLGWGAPRLSPEEIGVSTIEGYWPCPFGKATPPIVGAGGNACKTVMTKLGLAPKTRAHAARAQLMIRVERACDLRLTFTFSSPTLVTLSTNGFTADQPMPAKTATFLVPKQFVVAGINVLTLEDKLGALVPSTHVATLAIAPVCDAP